MRKLVCSAVLGLLGVGAYAQDWTAKFNHLSGTQVYNTLTALVPISVTVSQVNGTPTSTATSCSAGPYYLAPTAATKGGYRYDFSPAVTHIKFEINELHDDDTIFIRVNNPVPGVGPITPITAGMLSPFANGCVNPTGPTNQTQIVRGMLTAPFPITAPPTPPPGPYHQGNNTTTLTYAAAPGFISSIEIVHMRDSNSSSGIVYNTYAAFDTCNQPIKATVDSPVCKGRTMYLHATNFPNTTFAWTTTASVSIPPGEATKSDPVIPNAQLPGSNGKYTVTATRGICNYVASVDVDVDNPPTQPLVTFQGPKCTGDIDTITANSSSNIVYFIKPNGTVEKANTPPFFNFIIINPVTNADAGIYKAVTYSVKGCVSDTGNVNFTLNSVVKADFSFKTKLGCDEDTVEFTDQSLGHNYWSWDFNDGSPIFQGDNQSVYAEPTHYYKVQSTYQVKLKVRNSVCQDSVTKLVVLNHPLIADFAMSDDSICQGEEITFSNLSTAAPATSFSSLWDFRDGSPLNGVFEPKHVFTRYGVYNVELTITDFLGCKKSTTKTLVVDSLGSATFFTDTVICAGESIKFLGDYSTIGGTYALWDFSDGHTIQDAFTIEHSFDKPGIYDVKLNAHYRVCRDTLYHQNIYVNAYPVVDLGPDTAMCPNGAPIPLKDLINDPAANPNYTWRWNTETKDSTASIIAHHPGSYSVTVDNQGCATADTIVIKKNCYIDIPNVFTPNGDGYNDYFLPRQFLSRNVSMFDMTIYNRWGAVVFQTKNLNGRGWDGKLDGKDQPDGVYVYVIKVAFGNGTAENYQGNITLLR